MEKLLTEIKRLVHEYEERQREKTMVLTGTVKGDSIFNSLQHSLQDVNAAGQLHDSSGVEIINSLYKAVHAYIESEDKLKAELAEKSDVIRKLKEENEELSRLAKHLSDAVRKGDDQKVEEKPDNSGVEELSPYIEHILNTNEELKSLLAEKNRELENKKKEITFLQGKLESKNKRIKELEDGDKGEGKVDRFEAGIEKLNEIVEVLNKWAYMQKGVISVFPKDRTDGGPECHFNHR